MTSRTRLWVLLISTPVIAFAVIGGYLVVHDGGLVATARTYGVAVMVLAGLALLGSLSRSTAVRGLFSQTRTVDVTSTRRCSAGTYGGSSSS